MLHDKINQKLAMHAYTNVLDICSVVRSEGLRTGPPSADGKAELRRNRPSLSGQMGFPDREGRKSASGFYQPWKPRR